MRISVIHTVLCVQIGGNHVLNTRVNSEADGDLYVCLLHCDTVAHCPGLEDACLCSSTPVCSILFEKL